MVEVLLSVMSLVVSNVTCCAASAEQNAANVAIDADDKERTGERSTAQESVVGSVSAQVQV